MEIIEATVLVLAGFLPTLAGLSALSKLYKRMEGSAYKVAKMEVIYSV